MGVNEWVDRVDWGFRKRSCAVFGVNGSKAAAHGPYATIPPYILAVIFGERHLEAAQLMPNSYSKRMLGKSPLAPTSPHSLAITTARRRGTRSRQPSLRCEQDPRTPSPLTFLRDNVVYRLARLRRRPLMPMLAGRKYPSDWLSWCGTDPRIAHIS